MPLSNLDLVNLVESQSLRFIKTASGLALKNAILERTPIHALCLLISEELNNQCEQEKNLFSQQKTDDYCQLQQQQDSDEAARDLHAQAHDKSLMIQFQSELQQLHLQIHAAKCQQDREQQQCMMHRAQLGTEESKMTNIRLKQTGIQSEIHTITERNREVQTTEDNTTDQNGFRSLPHYASTNDPSDQARLIYLRTQAQQLESERYALQLQLDKTRQSLSQTESSLKRLAAQLREQEKRQGHIKNQTEVVLPNQHKQREDNRCHRQQRAYARTVYDPELAQLSVENKSTLLQKIQTEHRRLNERKIQLENDGKKISHNTFITQLAKHVGSRPESNALKNLLDMFHRYVTMESESYRTQKSIDDNKSVLKRLHDQLVDNQRQLHNIPGQIAALREANEGFIVLNQQLNTQIPVFKSRLKDALIVATIFLTIGGVSGGLLSLTDLDLWLYSYPIGLGFSGLVSLCVGLIYHCKALSANDQIQENSATTEDNNHRMEEEGRRAIQLREHTIPAQEKDIKDLTTRIEQQTQAHVHHHAQMRELWQSALDLEIKASSLASHAVGFFQGIWPSTTPSAPEPGMALS